MNIERVPGRRAAILGLGISGFETAVFLKRRGFDVFVSEFSSTPEILERGRILTSLGINVETGQHTAHTLLERDWVMVSPGIPPTSDIYQKVRNAGLPLYSEIEVASWFCPTRKIIGVTGTCGKTTTVTLLSRVLQTHFGKAVCCGNIGNPWIGEMESLSGDDYVVIEISSFQLVHCESFRPWIGVLLNLSENHQDWHPDMADYARAKLKMFENQTDADFAVFRPVDRELFFPQFSFRAKEIMLRSDPGSNPNETVVRTVAGIIGVPAHVTDRVIQEFEGVEHRLEKFHESAGIRFINDSKCTTTASLCWALEKFPDRKVVLIAGGHPKSDDFDTVRSLIQQKVKTAVLIGEAEPSLRRAWGGACPLLSGGMDFDQAITLAISSATKGDIVLLSPACASFDMFKNYIQRGKLFKQKVLEQISRQTLTAKA